MKIKFNNSNTTQVLDSVLESMARRVENEAGRSVTGFQIDKSSNPNSVKLSWDEFGSRGVFEYYLSSSEKDALDYNILSDNYPAKVTYDNGKWQLDGDYFLNF